MSGTLRGKRSATAIPQTPAKEPKDWENMEVDSDDGTMEEGTQGTENGRFNGRGYARDGERGNE